MKVTGAERVGWLQGLLTNDVAALSIGAGCYAAWLTPQGRMITDVRVLDRGDHLLLDLPGDRTAAVLERLDGFIITEDVTLEDVTARLARLGLHGPRAWATLASVVDLPSTSSTPSGAPAGDAALEPAATALPTDEGGAAPDGDNPSSTGSASTDAASTGAAASGPATAALAEHASLTATFQGQPLLIAGSRDTGQPGVDIYIASEQAAALRAALLAAGAEEVEAEAWEARRIEAGRPRFGADMTEDTIPLEANLEQRAISFTKGCYVGQEIIIRVTHRGGGRVARRLVGLAPDPDAPDAGRLAESTRGVERPAPSGAVPAAGTLVFSGERQIGHVTSAAFSPSLGHWIAMAYLHRDFVSPGTAVRVGGEADAAAGAHVSELPFVAPAAAH